MIQSTHTCNLDIPWLPNTVTKAHIVQGLSYSYLISTRKFTDSGCKVIFDIYECKIHYKGVLVLTVKKDRTTGLWNLPINPIDKPSLMTSIDNCKLQFRPNQHLTHSAKNVHTLATLSAKNGKVHAPDIFLSSTFHFSHSN